MCVPESGLLGPWRRLWRREVAVELVASELVAAEKLAAGPGAGQQNLYGTRSVK